MYLWGAAKFCGVKLEPQGGQSASHRGQVQKFPASVTGQAAQPRSVSSPQPQDQPAPASTLERTVLAGAPAALFSFLWPPAPAKFLVAHAPIQFLSPFLLHLPSSSSPFLPSLPLRRLHPSLSHPINVWVVSRDEARGRQVLSWRSLFNPAAALCDRGPDRKPNSASSSRHLEPLPRKRNTEAPPPQRFRSSLRSGLDRKAPSVC
jgi:hypothetical protein